METVRADGLGVTSIVFKKRISQKLSNNNTDFKSKNYKMIGLTTSMTMKGRKQKCAM